MHIAAMNSTNIEVLFTEPFIKDQSLSIENLIKGVIAKVGENIRIEKFCYYAL